MDDTEIVPGDDTDLEENKQDTEPEQDTDDEDIVEGGEGPNEVEPELPPQQTHQKQTANQRIQQVIAEKRAMQEELDAYRRHLLKSVEQPPAPKPVLQDPAEMRRKLESMDDVDRIMYMERQFAERQAQERQALQFQMMVQTDKAEFNSYLTENPEYKRFAPDVEREFQNRISKGQPMSRDEILAIVVGREVREKGKGAIAKAAKAGAARIQNQTTKPASVRSGVASAGGKVAMSPEEVLFGRLARREYSDY